MKHDISQVCRNFDMGGEFVNAAPYGGGHINDTYLVECRSGKFIVQRVNTAIFREPEALMENFQRVTTHIAAKIAAAPRDGRRRETLHLVDANDGRCFYRDETGNFWRCYRFVDRAVTYDIIENTDQAFTGAAAFGEFQSDLADLPGRLNETIKDFHHTPKRLEALKRAVENDPRGRLREVGAEVEFMLKRENFCSLYIDMQKSGELVERITHNDTKLNNVLIDEASGRSCCVIDLDTTMPGLPHYDFGDMLRTGTSPAAEDERDLGKVCMRFEMYEALLRGFLSTAGNFLSPVEKAMLPQAGILLTLETGIRFLTDYLDGDVYFKTARPDHNLDRCRTQIKLVESMEKQLDEMKLLCDDLAGR